MSPKRQNSELNSRLRVLQSEASHAIKWKNQRKLITTINTCVEGCIQPNISLSMQSEERITIHGFTYHQIENSLVCLISSCL